MRLLLVTNDYPPRPGGIQQYLGNLAVAYPHPLRVLAPAGDEDDPRVKDDPRVVRSGRRFMWPTRSVARWVGENVTGFRPDVVLFGAPYPLAHLGPRLRSATGVPYAVLCHGAEATIPAGFPVAGRLLRGPLKRSDAVFAVSRFTAEKIGRLSRRSVHYVGSGVDVDVFTPFTPAAKIGSDGPVVGCVSRFVPRKGQRRLVEAVARLRSGGIDARVLLVGQGRDERALRRLAERLGVPARFEVGVPWERLPGLYREMDLFAMPCRSRWLGLEIEGLGIVYLEAAASGLAVLAGDSGGAPEAVVPGVTGFVVHSVESLVEALELFIADPERALRMGERGRQRVQTEFTWEKVVARLLEGLRGSVPGSG